MNELAPLLLPFCLGALVIGLPALPRIYRQLRINYELRKSLKEVTKK